MIYHVNTGLIKEKFQVNTECPICEIKKVVEDQLIYEFLNDAVMDDDVRADVNKKGFCRHHFDMLFSGKNKLSLALQVSTRLYNLHGSLKEIKNAKSAKKLSEKIKASQTTCVICDYLNESMQKYYKAVAQLFKKEKSFSSLLLSTQGFCMEHFAELLAYSSDAGLDTKSYLSALYKVQDENLTRLEEELNRFCKKHDYRNALMPLGSAETALPRAGEKLYGKKNNG